MLKFTPKITIRVSFDSDVYVSPQMNPQFSMRINTFRFMVFS